MIIQEIFYDLPWYICYPHTGKNGDNEHYHIFTPELDHNRRNLYRTRITRSVGSGNKYLSIKSCKNGLAQAIQYGSKEGTQPITRGDVQQWIDDAPPWIPGASTAPRKRKRRIYEDPDGEQHMLGIVVNKYNIVQIAARYYKKCNKDGWSNGAAWRNTLCAMLRSNDFDFQFTEKLDGMYELFFRQAIGLDTPERAVEGLIGIDLKIPSSI